MLPRNAGKHLFHAPLNAFSIAATSIFFIVIIAWKARPAASRSELVVASISCFGVTCHDRPKGSFSQPHWLSWPPLAVRAFQ